MKKKKVLRDKARSSKTGLVEKRQKKREGEIRAQGRLWDSQSTHARGAKKNVKKEWELAKKRESRSSGENSDKTEEGGGRRKRSGGTTMSEKSQRIGFV